MDGVIFMFLLSIVKRDGAVSPDGATDRWRVELLDLLVPAGQCHDRFVWFSSARTR
jgi:hypothetical protein